VWSVRIKMKVAALFVLLAVSSSATSVTPVQKVIQLLNGMVAKGKQERQEEQVQFAAYKQWCDDTTVEKQRAIKEANEAIERYQADIEKNEADAEQLGHEISVHDEDIATWEGDQKAATKVREIEKADYESEHQDMSESISALGGAVDTMGAQAHDVGQAAAVLTQLVKKPLIPDDAKKVINAFLDQVPDDSEHLAVAAPEANAFEFASQGIIDLLDKLGDKFKDQRTKLEKEEMKDVHGYQMLMQDLQQQIDSATQARTEKSEAKAKALQAAADAKGNLGDTTETRDADMKFLADMTATCTQKASDFENRQQLRADEIEAVEKATEILSGDDVSGAADKHLPALAQMKGASFAQLRAKATNPNQVRVAAYLQDQADRLNSRVLSTLAVRVAYDPFKSVKKMIKDLVVKLMEEANEEAEHKGWCDTELSTNEQTRKQKTEAVEMLHAEIDQLEASIAKLTEEITELTAAVAELDSAVAEATKIREEEKAKNTATIADAQAASTAVAQAMSVLKEFYDKAGEATSLVQKKKQPEIFDKPYTGMQAESGGVMGMLEVIQSDFARLESETGAAEAQSQKEYDEFMQDSAVDKAAKSKDIEHKSGKKTNQEQTLVEKKDDLFSTQKELDAAMTYYEKLKPSCVDAGISYEDRVARRKEEIESLQEALRILNGEDIAFFQK